MVADIHSNRSRLARSLPVLLMLTGSLILLTLSGCSTPTDLPPGNITGRVYLDEDADSECDVCDCDFYLEGIVIRLYKDSCGGLVRQTAKTNQDGVFSFNGLPPGDYCVSPKVKTICEGYQPTTPIQQKVTVLSGQSIESPWFGFDHNLDIYN